MKFTTAFQCKREIVDLIEQKFYFKRVHAWKVNTGFEGEREGSAYKYQERVWDENGKNNKIINKNSMIFRQNFYCCYRSKSNFISTDHDLLSDQRNFKERE